MISGGGVRPRRGVVYQQLQERSYQCEKVRKAAKINCSKVWVDISINRKHHS